MAVLALGRGSVGEPRPHRLADVRVCPPQFTRSTRLRRRSHPSRKLKAKFIVADLSIAVNVQHLKEVHRRIEQARRLVDQIIPHLFDRERPTAVRVDAGKQRVCISQIALPSGEFL